MMQDDLMKGRPDGAGSNSRTLSGRLDALCAQGQGERAAVFHGHDQWSYARLRDEALAMARAMHAHGIGPGDRVGLLMENRPENLAMFFAAAYVGATLVPMNTWYKRNEIDFTLRHCRMTCLIFTPRFLNQDFGRILTELMPDLPHQTRYPELRTLVSFGGEVRGVLPWPAFLQAGRGVEAGAIEQAGGLSQPDDTAMILYTSGSTADPKGVVLNHRNLLRNGRLMGERRNIDATDRIWLGSPLFYGLGSANALPVVLMAGGALVLQDHFDAGQAIELIQRTSATGFYGTGNMARAMLDHPDFARSKVDSMRKGNAGTTSQYKRMVIEELGVSDACSVYGLTECYGNATVSHFDDPLEQKINTCGTPLAGVEFRIVDPETFRPLAPGQAGLVLLRGRIAKGYLNNPAEGSRAYLPDGWFNTGDLGSFDSDGRFIFHSRLKEVIKSGGINISPLEVEQLLIGHPDVQDAHVISVPDDTRGETLVAVVTGKATLAETALKAFVRERAASFKVPHHVFWRSEADLPRLASGKIDRRSLKDWAARELGCGEAQDYEAEVAR